MPEEDKASISSRVLRNRDTWTWISGIVVVILVLAGAGKHIVDTYSGLLNADRMIRVAAQISGAGARSVPVTLISIDDETRAKWGNPIITHHSAVAGLIRLARDKGATSIVVDIDLSPESSGQGADENLSRVLAEFTKDSPPLMLVRNITFRETADRDGNQQYVADAVRPTPYDTLVAGKAHWVNAVGKFEGDRVARKIQLWMSVCNAGGGGTAYASPVLYVAARATGRPLDEIDAFLKGRVADDCDGDPPPPPEWPARRTPGVAVQYLVGPHTPNISAATVVMKDGTRVPVFRNVPAWTLLDVAGANVSSTRNVDASPFERRNVVIGVTHANSRDVNSTPLGSQPGVLILTNSLIASPLLSETPELSQGREIAIVVAIFVVFAAIGSRLHLVIATLSVALLSFLALLALSRQFGFDAAIRIVGIAVTLVALHRLADALAGIVYDWRRGLGWRALLKSKPEFRKP